MRERERGTKRKLFFTNVSFNEELQTKCRNFILQLIFIKRSGKISFFKFKNAAKYSSQMCKER